MRDLLGYLDIEERRIASLFKEVSDNFRIKLDELVLRDITHSFNQGRTGWQSLVIFECEHNGDSINFSLPFDHFMDNDFSEVRIVL